MPLTTVPACKSFRGIDSEDTDHDAELERIIAAVQSFLELECGRKFDLATVTEYYNGAGHVSTGRFGGGSFNGLSVGYRPVHGDVWRDRILVAQPPVVSITNLWDDPLRVYDTVPLLTSQYVIADPESGLIRLDGIIFQHGIHNIKITYVGGYAEIPPDLEQAAIEMVWAAREKGLNNLIGVRSRALAGDNVQYLNLTGIMDLEPIISKYRLHVGAI